MVFIIVVASQLCLLSLLKDVESENTYSGAGRPIKFTSVIQDVQTTKGP